MQYSLKSVIFVISLVAVFCAVARVFPPAQFSGMMLVLLFVSLLPYMAAQCVMVLIGTSDRSDIFPFLSTIYSNPDTPTLTRASIAFLFSTILLIAIYPLAREIGSSFSQLSFGVDDLQVSFDSAFQRTALRLSLPELWRMLYTYAVVHVVKWIVFFAVITLFAGLTFARHLELKHLFSRLLYFSPWLFVLHFGMLTGVWIDDSSITGPEGTVFYWASCIEPTWINRLAIPVAVVGYFFSNYVLRLSFKSSVMLAVATIPLAIWATVAANELGSFLI
jgi:hypothetical protein